MERESTYIQENDIDYRVNQKPLKLKTEVWQQDPHNQSLWHGVSGVIVNSEALEYREEFFEIVRNYH